MSSTSNVTLMINGQVRGNGMTGDQVLAVLRPYTDSIGHLRTDIGDMAVETFVNKALSGVIMGSRTYTVYTATMCPTGADFGTIKIL